MSRQKAIIKYSSDVFKNFENFVSGYPPDVKAILILTFIDGEKKVYEFGDVFEGKDYMLYAYDSPFTADTEFYNLENFRNLYRKIPRQEKYKNHEICFTKKTEEVT